MDCIVLHSIKAVSTLEKELISTAKLPPKKSTMNKSFSFLLVAFFAVLILAEAKINRNAPHGHNGKMKQYTAGPFGMKIKSEDEKKLLKGNPVMKQLPADDPTDKLGGKAICVQDVEAPKSAVWRQILDMDSYVGKVNKVKECKNYVVKDKGDGTKQIKTKMVLGVMPGYSVSTIKPLCCLFFLCNF